MEARETSGTVFADACFAVFRSDIIHGTNTYAFSATDAVLICHDASEVIRCINRCFFERIFSGMIDELPFFDDGNESADSLLLLGKILLIHFGLVNEAIAGHRDAERKGKLLTMGLEKGIHSPRSLACMTAIGGNGENIRIRSEFYFVYHFADRIGHITVIDGENEADGIRILADFRQCPCGDNRDQPGL